MTPAAARAELRDSTVLDCVNRAIDALDERLDRPWMASGRYPEERDLAIHARGRLIELRLELEYLCDGPLGSRLSNRINAEAEADRDDDETYEMEKAA